MEPYPHPRKRFGQHFLIDANLSRKIVDYAAAVPSEPLMEIGPGRGVLTRLLLAQGVQVVAVEIDFGLAAQLREEFAAEIADGRLTLIEADVLKWMKTNESPATRWLANLPYNITTPFLLQLCELPRKPESIVLMLQRDVVDRLLTEPGDERWGWPNFRLRLEYTLEFGFPVGRKVFAPPPHVDSAIIRLTPRPDAPEISDKPRFLKLVEASFRQRRRMLRQVWKGLLPEPVLDALKTTAPDEMMRRGESLHEAEWLDLYRRVLALLGA